MRRPWLRILDMPFRLSAALLLTVVVVASVLIVRHVRRAAAIRVTQGILLGLHEASRSDVATAMKLSSLTLPSERDSLLPIQEASNLSREVVFVLASTPRYGALVREMPDHVFDRAAPLDAWGNPVTVVAKAGTLCFVSAGPDGRRETLDDNLYSLELAPAATP